MCVYLFVCRYAFICFIWFYLTRINSWGRHWMEPHLLCTTPSSTRLPVWIPNNNNNNKEKYFMSVFERYTRVRYLVFSSLWPPDKTKIPSEPRAYACVLNAHHWYIVSSDSISVYMVVLQVLNRTRMLFDVHATFYNNKR